MYPIAARPGNLQTDAAQSSPSWPLVPQSSTRPSANSQEGETCTVVPSEAVTTHESPVLEHWPSTRAADPAASSPKSLPLTLSAITAMASEVQSYKQASQNPVNICNAQNMSSNATIRIGGRTKLLLILTPAVPVSNCPARRACCKACKTPLIRPTDQSRLSTNPELHPSEYKAKLYPPFGAVEIHAGPPYGPAGQWPRMV